MAEKERGRCFLRCVFKKISNCQTLCSAYAWRNAGKNKEFKRSKKKPWLGK